MARTHRPTRLPSRLIRLTASRFTPPIAPRATAPPEHPVKSKAGSITDPAFLALVSDQVLRTVVIAGRPDIGQPDWRSDLPGHPMSDQEVTDVVGWLSSQRPGAQQNKAGGGSQ